MLGTLTEIRVIFTEEFRRVIQRKSYRVMTLAVPVILLVPTCCGTGYPWDIGRR